MKKFKLLRFGKCYVNRRGDIAVKLLRGNKRRGYQLEGSCNNPIMFVGRFQLVSRVVPNDGNWIEITQAGFGVASTLHSAGEPLQLVPDWERDMIGNFQG